MDTIFQEHQRFCFGYLKAGEFEAYQHKSCESEPKLWYFEKRLIATEVMGTIFITASSQAQERLGEGAMGILPDYRHSSGGRGLGKPEP